MKQLQPQQALNRWINYLYRIEDGFLVLLLTVMIVVAVAQIIMRNLFDGGISWAGPFSRLLVLWVGLAGAMVATRYDHHITIDVLTRYLPYMLNRLVRIIVDCFTAAVSTLIAYHATRLVILDKTEETIAFAGIPAWWCELIIPFAFTVIALRYLVFLIIHVKDLVSGMQKA